MYSSPSTAIRVLRLRVKDKHAKWLSDLAREVNTVFNYCNELSVKVFERERRFLSGFDFWPFLKGVTRGGADNIGKSDWPGVRVAVPAGPSAGFPLRSERFAIEGDRSTSRDVGCRCGTAMVFPTSNC